MDSGTTADKNKQSDAAVKEAIKKIKEGDVNAFRSVINMYKNLVFSLALKSIGDYGEAEDAVQEVFVKMFEKLQTYDTKRPFFPWMYTLAINTVRDHLKKKQKQKSKSTLLSEENREMTENSQDPDMLPEDNLLHGETAQKVLEVLDAIDPGYRLFLSLHYFENMSVKQIAARTETSENTVKTRLRRGRKQILETITKNDDLKAFFKDQVSFGDETNE